MACTIVNTRKSFNWTNILLFNISTRAKKDKGMKNLGFYMTTYLIHVVCIENLTKECDSPKFDNTLYKEVVDSYELVN